MERLIFEFSIGDGYTFSADCTQPVVYSSKEQAMEDFELLLITRIESLNENNLIKDKHYSEYNKLQQQFSKLNSDKRTSEKDKSSQLKTLIEKMTTFRDTKLDIVEKNIKELYTLDFGGQNFDLSNFIYLNENTKKHDYSMPHIFSLDDYFHHVENSHNKSKGLKI